MSFKDNTYLKNEFYLCPYWHEEKAVSSEYLESMYYDDQTNQDEYYSFEDFAREFVEVALNTEGKWVDDRNLPLDQKFYPLEIYDLEDCEEVVKVLHSDTNQDFLLEAEKYREELENVL